ncbi:hypothetical protein CUMW_140750 [Citrus unshiu]|uniref:60S ribosomal protein L35a n=1 Tax=Citrus unshiu TaxID=55188 RepID=A0A2H5PJM5_CITUN|nr:hypothetical protein CUMW_140750 [Citrus unshiu]
MMSRVMVSPALILYRSQPQSHLQSLLCCSVKMVKGRQGERVRLYVRGTILGYKRSKSNQYPNTSLIQIEGVNTKEDVETELGSSCTPATSEVLRPIDVRLRFMSLKLKY